jgi:hypothetical protein
MSTSRAICSLSALTLLGCVQRPPAGGGQSGEEYDEAAWQPCVEAGRSPVAAGAVAPNGVRIDDVVAAVNGSASLPFVWVDGSSTTLQLSLGTGADGVWVDMEPNTGGGADTGPTPAIEIADTGGGAVDECPDWLELDLRLGFFTDDGAFAEDRSLKMQVFADGVGAFSTTLPLAELSGAWAPSEGREGLDPGAWDEVRVTIAGAKGLGDAFGTVSAQASRVNGEGPDGTAEAAMFEVATWGAGAAR